MENLPSEIYFVRHGSVNQLTKELNSEGGLEAIHAGQKLLAMGLGETATVLASSTKRTIQTAEAIAQVLGARLAPPSSWLYEAGNMPQMLIRDVEHFLLAANKAENLGLRSESPLVVVTHAPMIALINGDVGTGAIENGEIYPYKPGSWKNDEFNKMMADVRLHDHSKYPQ